MTTTILILVLTTTFLQVLHCFEEIAMDAYKLIPKSGNKPWRYLRAASVLVGLNFFIVVMLALDVKIAIYLTFYTIIVSVVNMAVHIFGYMKAKTCRATLGAGVFSAIPLGLSGIALLVYLIKNLTT